MDLDTIKFSAKFKIRDILFNTYSNIKMGVNLFCIFLQTILNIGGLICAVITKLPISLYLVSAIFSLLFVVLFNNYISHRFWKKYVKQMEKELDFIFDLVENKDDTNAVLELLKNYSKVDKLK